MTDLGELTHRTDALLRRYQESGDRAVLTEAVTTARLALAAAGPQWSALVGVNLASALRLVDAADGNESALRESIMLDERFTATAADTGRRLAVLDRLAEAYRRLAGSRPRVAAEGELSAVRRAAAIRDPGRAARLDRLRELLSDGPHRAELVQVVRDLMAETAHPAGSPPHLVLLSHLAVAQRELYKESREPADLDAALDCFRELAGQVPDGELGSMFHGELGRRLLERYQERQDPADLDAALAAADRAVTLGRTGRELLSLANVHRAVADRTGSFAELRLSIELYREALPGLAPEHAERARGHLADAMAELGGRTGEDDLVRDATEMSAAQRDMNGRVLHWQHLLARAERPDATGDEAEKLVRYARELVADATAEDRPYRMSDLSVSLRVRYEATEDRAILDEAVTAGRAAVATVPAGDPRRYRVLALFGQTLRMAARVDDDADLAVDVCTEALESAGPDHPDRPRLRGDLANALLLQSGYRPDDAALLPAVVNHATAAVAGAKTTAEVVAALPALAVGQGRLATAGQDPDALDAAIARCREALALPLSRPARAGVQATVAGVLVTRLRIGDLDGPAIREMAREGLHTCREALAVHPGVPTLRAYLLALLMLVMENTTAIDDLRDLATTADELVGGPDPESLALRFAGLVYEQLAERTQQLPDIEAAIRYQHELADELPRGHPERVPLLQAVAAGYRMRLAESGSPADADHAVRFGQAALDEAGPDQAARFDPLTEQSAHLRDRFRATGRRSDLVEAERIGRADPRAGRFLPDTLMLRYQADQDTTALDEAATLSRTVVAANRDPSFLIQLANVLSTLYHLRGVQEDLDEAIALVGEAIESAGPDHPGSPIRLGELATLRTMRYLRTKDPADHREALRCARAALDLVPPGSQNQPRHLSVLFAVWLAAPDEDGAAAELDRLIEMAPAVADPHWPALLHYLGVALHRRHRRLGDPADLDRAIDLLRMLLDQPRLDDAQVIGTRTELGEALMRRNGAGDRAAAIELWREASEPAHGNADRRIEALLFRTAGLADDPAAQLPLLRQALDLLAELCWHGSPRADQQRALSRWSGLAGEAAAVALDNHSPDTAVELLEQGRAVLWARLLDDRTILDAVARVAPTLADRMRAVSAALDATGELATAAPPDTDTFAGVEVDHALALLAAGDEAAAEAILVRYADTGDPRLTATCSVNLGILRYRRDDLDGAVADLSRALNTGWGTPAMAAGNLLSGILGKRGQLDDARRVLADVLRIDGDARAAAEARERLVVLGELERDPTGLLAMAGPQLASGRPDAILVLAMKLLERGNPEDVDAAGRLIERAWEIDGKNDAHLSLVRARFLDRSGDVAGAMAALRKLDGAEARLQLADLALEAGDPDEAFALYRELAAGPDGEQARQRLATLDLPPADQPAAPSGFDYGRWMAFREPPEPAVATLRAAVAAGDRTARTQLHLALVMRLGDTPAAVTAAYRQGVLLGAAEPAVVAFCRAGLRAARGDRSGVTSGFTSAYEQAVRAGDTELATLSAAHLGHHLEEHDDVAGAAAAYRRALGGGDRHLSGAAGLALALLLDQHGDRDGANAMFRQVFEREHPYQSPIAGLELASGLAADGNDAAAAEMLRRVMAGPQPDAAAEAAGRLAELVRLRPG
ncbi:hypothetical protein [Actinoplanes sp. NPDC026619]|uniref:hypothetical protein n=1 Tax=Actinoplanes sp. NPDC026619 TaxID=3155798 RepID=UPI0033FE3860